MSARRIALALALLAVTLGGAVALTRFQLEPDLAQMFPQDSELATLLRETTVAEDAARSLFLLIHGENLEAELGEILAALRTAPALARVEGSVRDFVDAEGAVEAPLWQLDAEALARLEQRLSPAGRAEAIEELRDRLATDPLASREVVLRDPLGLRWTLAAAARRHLPAGLTGDSPYLLADDDRTAVVRVVGRRDPFDLDYARTVMEQVRERLTGRRFEAVGGYAIAVADAARIRHDLESSLWWSIPLILLFLAGSLRSFWLPHLALAPIAAALIWTLGYGGLALGPLTPLAVSAAAILIGLGIDYSLHFLGRFHEEWPAQDADEALATVRRRLGRALLGGMLTTTAAFATVAFGDFPGLRDLALLLGFGLVNALLATWLVLPLLLRVRPGRADAFPVAAATRLALRIERSRAGAVCAGVVLLVAAAGWALAAGGGLRFDADPRHMRPADAPGTVGTEELEQVLGLSPHPILVLAPPTAALEELRAGVERLRADDGVIAWSTGPHRSIPSEAQRQRVADFRAATSGWADAALDELAAAGFARAPFEAGIRSWEERLAADPPASDAAATRTEGDAPWQLRLFPRETPVRRSARAALRARIDTAFEVPIRMVSAWTAADELGPALKETLQQALLACALAVAILLVVVLRSVRAGLVALLPALCGLGACVGVMTLSGWVIHPGNLLALPLVLGLGVDDGIHMVLRAREDDADPVTSTGSQIWRTSVTTALGFGSLVAASSPAIASLGGIVLVGTITCFVASVVLVPQACRCLLR